MNRIIVIGASTGGVGALCTLVQDLPQDLPAAIPIVQHVGKTSLLPEILRRCHNDGNVLARDDTPRAHLRGGARQPSGG